jgi:hypothetical protein
MNAEFILWAVEWWNLSIPIGVAAVVLGAYILSFVWSMVAAYVCDLETPPKNLASYYILKWSYYGDSFDRKYQKSVRDADHKVFAADGEYFQYLAPLGLIEASDFYADKHTACFVYVFILPFVLLFLFSVLKLLGISVLWPLSIWATLWVVRQSVRTGKKVKAVVNDLAAHKADTNAHSE